jgi:hypothetical protein
MRVHLKQLVFFRRSRELAFTLGEKRLSIWQIEATRAAGAAD